MARGSAVRHGRLRTSQRPVPTRGNVLGASLSSASSSAGIDGNKFRSSTEGASNRTTATGRADRFCWCARFLSSVTKASKSVPASARSFPFLVPDQPISPTVRTSCKASALRNRIGTDSSSSRRIGRELLTCRLEDSHRCISGDRREVLEELFQSGAAFEVLEQTLHRHSRAGEARRTAHDLGVSRHKRSHRRLLASVSY